MTATTAVCVALIGLSVGFLSGMFGKGGSAIATPLLHAAGIPAIIALASPLPGTIPSTLAGTLAYRERHMVSRRIFVWSLAIGVPATVVGAVATRWIGGELLVTVTEAVIVVLGIRFVVARGVDPEATRSSRFSVPRIVAVAGAVGIISGLLANSGGFLLAPLYIIVLATPIKRAFGTSLAVATVLAIPGTIVHAWLGHVDWAIVSIMVVTATPSSFLGARVALRTNAVRLERLYGAALVVLGIVFLLHR